MRPVRTAFAGALLGALVLAGCGQDRHRQPPRAAAPPRSSSAAPGAAFPVTVEAGNGPVTIAKRPERIVSLSATHTETLFAIGAGPQVVAVDDQSNYPAEAPKTDLSGLQAERRGHHRATKPDLVVLSDDIDQHRRRAGQGRTCPCCASPPPPSSTRPTTQITDLGAATGNAGQGRRGRRPA